MNRLNADLKRLLTWSRRGALPERDPEEAPCGFASRIVASWSPAQNGSLLAELRQFAWASTCVALVVIMCGFIVLVRQPQAPEPAAGIPSALSFVASNLTP
jgi:hypothetical protein